MLWLDEIQGGVWQSNKDTQEAQRCMYRRLTSVSMAGRGGTGLPTSVFSSVERWGVGRGQLPAGEQLVR